MPFTRSARNRGCVALTVDTHMTLADSNKIELNVIEVGDANTVGALPAVPIKNVPPDRGEKIPFVSVLRLVIEAMPGVLEEVDTNSPPSGEMARPRLDPEVDKDVTFPDCPSLLT